MTEFGDHWQTLRRWSREPQETGVFTDVDGTLAPIVPTPDLAEVSGELREILRALHERFLIVAGISGRSVSEALDLVGIEELVYHGNHGFEVLRDGRVEVAPEAAPYAPAIAELERRSKEELGPTGAVVEEKGITASVHYRNVPREVGERCVDFVQREGRRLGLDVMVGRGVVEARPPIRVDKGTAIRSLVEEYGPRKALFVGDDITDLDAFRELKALRDEGTLREILRVGVASAEGPPRITSEADLVVDGVDGVGEALRALLNNPSG